MRQFRITGDLQNFLSRLCYSGSLQDAEYTLLSNRLRSQKAISFLKNQSNLVTDIPHLYINIQTRISLNSRIKSHKKLPKVVIKTYIVELVVEAGIFTPKKITIITPYKEQVSSIRQALKLSALNRFFGETHGMGQSSKILIM